MMVPNKRYSMAAAAAATSILAMQARSARAMVSMSQDAGQRHRRGGSSTRQSSPNNNNNNWLTPPLADPNQMLSNPVYCQQQVDRLLEWWSGKQNVLVLTGAGMSTESGIPDYRGHNGSYHRGHKPMIHTQFVTSEYQRKRYWGRAMVGWKSMERKDPNQGHLALAQLERLGRIGVALPNDVSFQHQQGESKVNLPNATVLPASPNMQQKLALVTQNVDSLHHRAGSTNVVELHGSLSRVKCMGCGSESNRQDFQDRLTAHNGKWLEYAAKQLAENQDASMRPDGDADVLLDFEQLIIPTCEQCNGFIKPDVVFFGDSVPTSRVALVSAAVDACDGLLVVGSSLAVHSAFRHVRAASQKGLPVAILNVGETRAETEGLTGLVKLEVPTGPTLARVADHFAANA